MSETLQQHYEKRLSKFGPSCEAVQWASRASQFRRFEVLAEILPEDPTSVVDVGCGLGDFLSYLRDTRSSQDTYLGLDFVSKFIDLAKETFSKDDPSQFQQFDICNDIFPKEYDYYILSGVFNNENGNNKEWMEETITSMFKAAKKGIAFNALSTYVDYYTEGLYYSNPLEVFDFCKRSLTQKVTLKHDYLVKQDSIPYEYTLYLYH